MTHGNTTHGHYSNGVRTKTYRVWEAMLGRCRNSKDTAFKNYGALDITVCNKWNNFEGFLEDMGEVPEGLVIDRIDNNKGYYKENCRWVTRQESGQNTSKVVLNKEKVVEIKQLLIAKTYSQAHIARLYNVTPQTIHHIKSGKQWRNC